eukprot:472539-Rhodomonas_salina.2
MAANFSNCAMPAPRRTARDHVSAKSVPPVTTSAPRAYRVSAKSVPPVTSASPSDHPSAIS